MVVLRRFDALLAPTKEKVLETKAMLDEAGVVDQDSALRNAAGDLAFYNTSAFTLGDLRNLTNRQQLAADFGAYLDGYSPNVQEILENFEFRNQIPRLSKADALGDLIHKLMDPQINLSSEPVLGKDGEVSRPGLDNHSMGTIFEELVRRFNEENNEEAGEHWTPRDAVKLMARLVFTPIADQIKSTSYLLYDGACVADLDRVLVDPGVGRCAGPSNVPAHRRASRRRPSPCTPGPQRFKVDRKRRSPSRIHT